MQVYSVIFSLCLFSHACETSIGEMDCATHCGKVVCSAPQESEQVNAADTQVDDDPPMTETPNARALQHRSPSGLRQVEWAASSEQGMRDAGNGDASQEHQVGGV